MSPRSTALGGEGEGEGEGEVEGEGRGQSNALSEVQARADVTYTVVALLSPSCSSFASRGEEMGMILQPCARNFPAKSDRAAAPSQPLKTRRSSCARNALAF